jgi:tripartite-type tricarboxylate transporter receptor subunit TctC
MNDFGDSMKLRRRNFLRLAAGAVALPAVSRIASAQSYPSRSVRMIIGYPAGGSADITARLTGQWLSERLGQPVVVESRPGAATNLATEAVVRAPADGYTLLLVAPANAINATLYDKDKLNFNFLADIVPVAGIIRFANVVVVNPSLPVKTIPELIAYAKANRGKLNMASSGNGSTIHMSGELFKMLTGIDMVHVPYRGGAPALTDLIAGQVQVMFDNIPTSAAHIKADRLRGLAVTSATRSDVLPNLPTVADVLPGYEASAWYGLGAPKGTPDEIVARVNKAMNEVLADPKAQARFAELGASLLPGSPAAFGKLVADETEKWGKVVKFAGVKPD